MVKRMAMERDRVPAEANTLSRLEIALRLNDDEQRAVTCAWQLCVVLALSNLPCLRLFDSTFSEGCVERCVLLSFLSSNQANLDEVERADERIAEAHATCARNGVAQRNGPMVLDEEERRC